MNVRRLAAGIAIAIGLVTPLVIVGTAESATPTSGRASTVGLAAAGQWITFRGHVSGGARPVLVYWGRAGYELLNPVRGRSNAAGNFAINYRMMTMPSVPYTVVAPAYGRYARWVSPTLTVKGRSQDVVLSCMSRDSNGLCVSRQFRAQLTWTDLAAMRTTNAPVAGRAITIQQQTSPGVWAALSGVAPQRTDASGATVFDLPKPGKHDVYRAVAAQMSNGLSTYVSFPVFITQPSLSSAADVVYDPPGNNLSPRPNSNNGSAQKYNWWPNNLFWDQEQGEGMQAQGCTTHCANWSDYSEGSGRVNIRDGQIALESFPAGGKPGWGYMSSTMQFAGYRTGRWEMRVHQAEWPSCNWPNSADKQCTYPYKIRISLVPAGTPDSNRSPSKQIILSQWVGYSSNVLISVNDGTTTRGRVLTGIQNNRANWHDVAVQITSNKIIWLMDGHAVGQAAIGTAITGTNWVARIEMIDQNGKSMDRARGGIDWVRYFNLSRSWAKPISTAGVPAF